MPAQVRDIDDIRAKVDELRRDLNRLRDYLAPELENLAEISSRRRAMLSEIDNRWRTFVPFMLKYCFGDCAFRARHGALV